MKKIPSLFARNYDGDRQVRDELVVGTEWVSAGEGTPTRKFDGEACMLRGGQLYRRYDAKKGRTPPANWEPCEETPDPNTGHWPGWVLLVPGEPSARWLLAARENTISQGTALEDGTYEACGPHFQDNPEGLAADILIRHGSTVLPDGKRTFAVLRDYLSSAEIEGIVWHHPDGRMVKIKAKDFGFKRVRGGAGVLKP